MKRSILMTVLVGCSTAWSVSAQDVDGRKGLSEAESKQRQDVIAKYDADGDGVLNKSEQKGLTKAEKQALAKTGGVGTARKASTPDAAGPGKEREVAGTAAKGKGSDRPESKPQVNKEAGASKGAEGGKATGGKK